MSPHASSATTYSVVSGARQALKDLRSLVGDQLPPQVNFYLDRVSFSTCSDGHKIYFPCPFKENEAAAALKAVEAGVVAAISDLRYGAQKRKIDVNLEKTAGFLFSTYIATIGGLGKGDPGVRSKLKGTQTPSSILSTVADLCCRYRSIPGTIHSVSKTVGKLIRNKKRRGIFSHTRFTGGRMHPEHDWAGGPQTGSYRLP